MVGPSPSSISRPPSTSSSYPNLIAIPKGLNSAADGTPTHLANQNGIQRKIGGQFANGNNANGGVSHSSSADFSSYSSSIKFANFPTTVAHKWRPRLTLPALLPVLQQLRGTTSPFKQANPDVPPPIPPISTFLNRSQSVASRYHASPDLIKDLSLRCFHSLNSSLPKQRPPLHPSNELIPLKKAPSLY